ncbi:MAG: cytochrome c oxidase assembly protein [Gammaproteobacteria bacterium]|nr:cytochrome c oxidase assembly protein [Gammaproteobacteria bacterium]
MKRFFSKKHLPVTLLVIALAMFGFGFALVPLYTLVCKTTGINGKTAGPSILGEPAEIDTSRWVTIQFLATNNANLDWKFYPETITLKLHPGENKLIYYYAENLSGQGMTVQAIPSVTPGLAAKHIKKTECFCFTQQTFKAGEKRHMPILFHVDNSLPKNINTFTLSYTLFNADKYKKSNRTLGRP